MRRQILLGSLAVAALAVLAVVVAVGLARRELLRRSEIEITRQATATAQIVDNQLSQTQEQGRQGGVIRLLEQLKLLGGHDYLEIAVVTRDGSVESLLDGDVLVPRLVGRDPIDEVVTLDVEGTPVIATARRVAVEVDDVARNWYVAIGRTEPLLAQGLFTRPLLFGLGIAFVLAAVMASVVAGRIGSRVDAVADAAGRVASGDLTARAEPSGDDEITSLAQSLNAMTEELDASSRRQREFLMSVGHELRTPLTTIRGYVEGLEEGTVDVADMPRITSVMRSQTDRLSRLIEDLMLLARLEAGEFVLQPEPVALGPHVTELVDAVRPQAQTLGVTLRSEIEDVGEIDADPDRIGQMVGNLLDNALRWTPEGGTIVVALRQQDGRVEIAVKDSGPGIDPEDLPRVFERMYVARRYAAVRPYGSGLGLSIVHELATAMGGRASATSTAGQGTEVAVTLPA